MVADEAPSPPFSDQPPIDGGSFDFEFVPYCTTIACVSEEKDTVWCTDHRCCVDLGDEEDGGALMKDLENHHNLVLSTTEYGHSERSILSPSMKTT